MSFTSYAEPHPNLKSLYFQFRVLVLESFVFSGEAWIFALCWWIRPSRRVSYFSVSYLFYKTAEGRLWKVRMISSSLAPPRSRALVCVSTIRELVGNIRKPTTVLCYLCSRAENAFLFFLKKKLLLNFKGNGAAHSWKNLGGKQKLISAVNVMLAGNCKIIIPL